MQLEALVALRLSHACYLGGRPTGLRFVAQPDTAAFVRRHQLVVRSDNGELWLHAPADRLEPLWSERLAGGLPRRLAWSLVSADPDYLYLTAAEAPQSVDFALAEEDSWAAWLARGLRRIEVVLPARRCVWKYLLVGDWRVSVPALHDRAETAEFRRDDDETLPDGRTAWVFRSNQPLAMGPAGPQHIALRDIGESALRTVRAHLPLATPRGITIERYRDQTQWVSEVFVHP